MRDQTEGNVSRRYRSGWRRASAATGPLALAVLLLALSAPGWSAELLRHTLLVDGHPLAVWSKSPPSPSAVLLLVHGRTWSTRPDFDLQVPGEDLSLMDGLVELGIAAYGIDLRGYGETPRDAGGWLTPNRAAADVAAALQWLQAQHPAAGAPALFGWSYGALVAQLATQLHGERVSALILFGYPLRDTIYREPESGEPARSPTTTAAARSDFILPGSISAAAVDAFVSSALRHDPVRMDWRSMEQWRQLDGNAVRRPTLLLQAAHDPLAIDAEHQKLFATLATDDKLWAVIPGGDHAAFLESPRAYMLTLIRDFVLRPR